ncbi:MAG TPA: methyl-accepting chemotaxis protein [Roseimicrobium sp.]|nr:methyl-accepting chemotaxis protein [Roseimicrobium sp.]
MKNWNVRQRITWSFGAVITLMIIMGAFAFMRLATIEQETSDMRKDSVPGLYYSSQIMIDWVDLYALVEHHVLTAELLEKQKITAMIEAQRKSLENAINAYEQTIYTSKDRQLFEVIQGQFGSYMRVQEEALKLSEGADAKAATAFTGDQLAREFEKIKASIQGLVDNNKADTDASTALIADTVGAAKTGLLVVVGVALLLALISGYFLIQAITNPLGRLVAVTDAMRQADFTKRVQLDRQDEFATLGDGFNRMADDLTALVGQVQQSGIQVNTSVNEIAATAKEQQATASEIAATTTEIGATSKEISATSKELVKTMGEVSSVAEQSAALAGNGQAGLSRMEDTMRHVMEAAGGINAKLVVLSEKAGNINQVVTTITKVADQTNLLSLNAAIEAEKAGEYGRGFAVVATEIRRLADQTAVATYDIEQMVKEMQSAVSAGVMGMDKFSEEVRRGMHEVQQVGGQLAQIIQQVQALAPRVESVNEGMQAQATGAEQISQALTQLSEAAQQTVESLRQSGLAIDELNKVSTGLRTGISRFKLKA